jgi:hypothetical protein
MLWREVMGLQDTGLNAGWPVFRDEFGHSFDVFLKSARIL